MTRDMKDSGIEWIGAIPEHWVVKSIRYLVNEHISGSWGNDSVGSENDCICIRIADFNFAQMKLKENIDYTIRNYNYSDIHNKTLKKGDLLIEKSGGGEKTPVGRTVVFRLNQKCLFANFMDCIRLKDEYAFEYAKYCFFALYKNGVTNLYFNQTTGLQNLNIQKYFREVKLPFPPIDEQQKIATYLDNKCGEIDAITAKIQEQITTLEEYKKSFISEAVTKGLNPNTEMKDSGIEWIGKIPANWEVDKFKYHLQRKEVKNKPELQVLSLYRELGVVPKDSRDDNHNVTPEDTSKYKYVKAGYFVVNKMKAWQGSVAVSDYEGIVSPAYYVYEFSDNKFYKRYFHYLLRGCYKDEFMRVSGGIRVGQWDLPADKLENMLVLIPSPTEQQEIADYLDSQCSKVEEAIADKQKQIETLEEYKKTLIYEYVTGKKEVA